MPKCLPILVLTENCKILSYQSTLNDNTICMKELDTCSSNAENVFNNLLRKAGNPAECAFGRLKAR